MSEETLYAAPRKYNVSKTRVHDYLYDSTFIVSGARDYARTAFQAAMKSAQVTIHPVYKTMFSEMRKCPRVQIMYHLNCRLPEHMDRSFGAYVRRVHESRNVPTPDLCGKHRFKFSAVPKKILPLRKISPNFQPNSPTILPDVDLRPRHRGTQSMFRESSAQTVPWQADAKPADVCKNTPEVLYLEKLEWGPGSPYRKGDLPADFHTTEIINKMRHARKWMELVEKGKLPRWMKKRDEIITDVETKDWIFREAEIDELQSIRLMLLNRMKSDERQQRAGRISSKLANLWACKKQEMERKIQNIRRTRDRELRKLSAQHGRGGKAGLAQEMKASRGSGPPTLTAYDPTSDLHAPIARNGYQARRRHVEITYDPSLLVLEDHRAVSTIPPWLESCSQDLRRTCSGHHQQSDKNQLCQRETKWSEQFLESLHNDLKKARLGASATTAGPLRVLKPRSSGETPRPPTPEVEAVQDQDEANHQAALLLQKIIRGRAVQNLMYEGRTRASELTEELKTTHGLQKEDKVRIAKEETKAREYNVLRSETEEKEAAISALVDELCGGAVSAALDFLEKELRRLKDERKQHAFILIALREKAMREAGEAGRRQKEEHRRREHDEMFKRILGVTQETVDVYLQEVIQEGVELAAEEDAVRRAQANAEKIEDSLRENSSMSTAEQNELVAELVQQFLLPEAHKAASRHHIEIMQQAKMEAARSTIFGLIDDAVVRERVCKICGSPSEDVCSCRVCPLDVTTPVETVSRDDPRWRHTRRRDIPIKSESERYPVEHEMRCTLNDLVSEAAARSRERSKDLTIFTQDYKQRLRERWEVAADTREMIDEMIDEVLEISPERKPRKDYHHVFMRRVSDALERTQPFEKTPCPKDLPSEIRRRQEEQYADKTCRCDDDFVPVSIDREERARMLPSQLRVLEAMRLCKCDTTATPQPSEATSEQEELSTEASSVQDTPEQEDEKEQ